MLFFFFFFFFFRGVVPFKMTITFMILQHFCQKITKLVLNSCHHGHQWSKKQLLISGMAKNRYLIKSKPVKAKGYAYSVAQLF